MEWIKTTDRMPKKQGYYIVYAQSLDPKLPLKIGTWYDKKNGWHLVEPWKKAITHWMPMPPDPV